MALLLLSELQFLFHGPSTPDAAAKDPSYQMQWNDQVKTAICAKCMEYLPAIGLDLWNFQGWTYVATLVCLVRWVYGISTMVNHHERTPFERICLVFFRCCCCCCCCRNSCLNTPFLLQVWWRDTARCHHWHVLGISAFSAKRKEKQCSCNGRRNTCWKKNSSPLKTDRPRKVNNSFLTSKATVVSTEVAPKAWAICCI